MIETPKTDSTVFYTQNVVGPGVDAATLPPTLALPAHDAWSV